MSFHEKKEPYENTTSYHKKSAKSAALKKRVEVPHEKLNAWGQDAKTAKAERKRLRQEKSLKAYRKNL